MVAEPMHRLWNTLKVLPTFAMLRADRSIYALAARRVKDERLRMALSFHPLFIGGDPMHVTSIYALVAHLEKTYGVHYAMGGVQKIADAMAAVVRAQGGQIRQEAIADEILVENGAAKSVVLSDGERVDAPLIDCQQCRCRSHLRSHLAQPQPQTLDERKTCPQALVDGPVRLVFWNARNRGPLG